jgi:hypothetical protein
MQSPFGVVAIFKNMKVKYKGIGDYIYYLLKYFGVKPWGDCGCDKRRKYLNSKFPTKAWLKYVKEIETKPTEEV